METIDIKELLKYLVLNTNQSSPFLSPEITHTLDLYPLLDKIAELRGITPEENGKQYNAIGDELFPPKTIKSV